MECPMSKLDFMMQGSRKGFAVLSHGIFRKGWSYALRLTILLVWLRPGGASAEVVDRLVAVVNRQVITLVDVEREAKFQNLDLPVTELTDGPSRERRLSEEQATQRLIEQVLIYQQIQEFPGTEVSAREVDLQIERMQKQAGGPEAWNRQLRDLKVSLDDVRERIKWQLQVMEFIDKRFRQFVAVDQNQIESYYKDRFLTDLRKRGIKPEPELSEVEEKIRDILTEEKLNVQVDEWLASLRANATIEIFH